MPLYPYSAERLYIKRMAPSVQFMSWSMSTEEAPWKLSASREKTEPSVFARILARLATVWKIDVRLDDDELLSV